MNEDKCPICGQDFLDGERRVSWFAKEGEHVTERGAIHLNHLTI